MITDSWEDKITMTKTFCDECGEQIKWDNSIDRVNGKTESGIVIFMNMVIGEDGIIGYPALCADCAIKTMTRAFDKYREGNQ